jgi:hypothetical protein
MRKKRNRLRNEPELRAFSSPRATRDRVALEIKLEENGMKLILLAAAAAIAVPAVAQTTTDTQTQTDTSTTATPDATQDQTTTDQTTPTDQSMSTTPDTTATTTTAAPDASAAEQAGGYQPATPPMSAPATPGANVVFQPSESPSQAFPPPPPLDHYPPCKAGQTDKCMQRGGR